MMMMMMMMTIIQTLLLHARRRQPGTLLIPLKRSRECGQRSLVTGDNLFPNGEATGKRIKRRYREKSAPNARRRENTLSNDYKN